MSTDNTPGPLAGWLKYAATDDCQSYEKFEIEFLTSPLANQVG